MPQNQEYLAEDIRPDSYQAEVVRRTEGPIACISPAGSGKTFTIAARTSQILNTVVNPEKLLLLSFTRSDANQLKSRVSRMHIHGNRVNAATIHSLSLSIIKLVSHFSGIQVLDVNHTLLGMQECFGCNRLIAEELREKVWAERVKGTVAGYASKFDSFLGTEYVDFDRMVQLAHDLLAENRWLREKVSSSYTHVTVDEYQDVDPLQYETLMMITPDNNMCVMADPRQSIYGFRYTDPKHVKLFVTETAADTVELVRNYRATKKLVSIVEEYSARNFSGYKPMLPNDLIEEGVYPRYIKTFTDFGLAESIRTEVDYPGTVGILYRKNSIGTKLQRYLTKYGFYVKMSGFAESPGSIADIIFSLLPDKKGKAHNIQLMSIHAAKGKEFDKVILALPEEIENTEEGERLFYVAVSRARKELVIVTKAYSNPLYVEGDEEILLL